MTQLERLENDLRIYHLAAAGLTTLARDMCTRCTQLERERTRAMHQLEEVTARARTSADLTPEQQEMVCQHTGYFRALVRVLDMAEELGDLRESGECVTPECMAQHVTSLLSWARG